MEKLIFATKDILALLIQFSHSTKMERRFARRTNGNFDISKLLLFELNKFHFQFKMKSRYKCFNILQVVACFRILTKVSISLLIIDINMKYETKYRFILGK